MNIVYDQGNVDNNITLENRLLDAVLINQFLIPKSSDHFLTNHF